MADLGAVFRSGPFTVDAGGRPYVFDHRSAAHWAEVLSSDNWATGALSMMGATSHERLLEEIEAGDVDRDGIRHLAHAALSAASGRPWWEAERLVSSLRHDSVLGSLLLKGCDPVRMSLAALCSAVWVLLMEGQDKTGRVQLEAEISVPPPEAAGEDGIEDDMSVMVARMRAMPGVSAG